MKTLILSLILSVVPILLCAQESKKYEGVIVTTPNPCLQNPCLPGIIYAINTMSQTYIITKNQQWQSTSNQLIVSGNTLNENDSVIIWGIVSLRRDINGKEYKEIEIEVPVSSEERTNIFPKEYIHILSAISDNSVYINSNNSHLQSIEVFDISGKQMYKATNINKKEFGVGQLEKGLYIFRVTLNNEITITKKTFIK